MVSEESLGSEHPAAVLWPSLDLVRVINRVGDGIFALDREWRIRFANLAAARMVRREVDDLLGKSLWTEFPTAVGSVFEDRYREALATQETTEFEAYFEALDAWFAVGAHPSEEGITLVFRDITRSRELRAERRALLVRLLESEERERGRIAADVHEDSVQALGVVALQLQILARHLDSPSPQVHALLESLREQVTRATDRLRALLFSLEPTTVDEPIARSIRIQAAHVFDESSIHWSVDDLDVGEELPRALRGQALRITKEALTNARAHAEASEVIVTLRGDDDGLEVHIVDNGVTLDPIFTSAPGHRGLATMRDRALVVGGWCTVEPCHPSGCSVRFYIPRGGTADEAVEVAGVASAHPR
jgi:signal transduction histidine kinase